MSWKDGPHGSQNMKTNLTYFIIIIATALLSFVPLAADAASLVRPPYL